MLNDFECKLKAIFPPKIQSQVGWQLTDKSFGKVCSHESCRRRQFQVYTQNGKLSMGSIDSLKLCKGCKKQYYCCRSHQKKDWERHIDECLKMLI